jgi:phosphoribosylanthranilate isomerase
VTRVKICGVRQVEHGLAAAAAGADYLGLIFAPTRRLVAPETAAEISRAAKSQGDIKTVGVFVNEDVRVINDRVRGVGLDYVQLSGDEPDEVIGLIDAPVIRVLHVRPDTERDALAQRLAEISSEIVLVDTARAGSYGGTGETFDWSILPSLDRPVLLAGGLHSGNVEAAIAAVSPWGVDVSSGVETDGVKDLEKIAAFVAAVKRPGARTDEAATG